MKRRDKPDIASGVIIIDKHEGVTSHRIVQILRKLYDTPRVGHTGTLDPLATGVLPVLIGRAVKASEFLLSNDKEYEAILQTPRISLEIFYLKQIIFPMKAQCVPLYLALSGTLCKCLLCTALSK